MFPPCSYRWFYFIPKCTAMHSIFYLSAFWYKIAFMRIWRVREAIDKIIVR